MLNAQSSKKRLSYNDVANEVPLRQRANSNRNVISINTVGKQSPSFFSDIKPKKARSHVRSQTPKQKSAKKISQQAKEEEMLDKYLNKSPRKE